MLASRPASRREIAVVSPITPHPTHYMPWLGLPRPQRGKRVGWTGCREVGPDGPVPFGGQMEESATSKAGFVATDVLARAGVRRLYTVPGESFLEILDAAERHPELALISTRHESGASFMAEADAKLTGMPAVAMATRGVGASNLSIGVHTAMQDSSPMLVLLGQVETDFLGREAFQEVDLPAFYAPITKWSATVNGADPKARVQTSPVAGPEPEQVRVVVRRLAAARRPVVIAGGGARRAREALISFAEAWGAGVYASFRRQDVFPNEHPNYLGHLTLGTMPE